MSIGLFTNKNARPTDKDLTAALGPGQGLWNSLVEYLREPHAVQEELKFCYGRKYGWARQFRSKGKLLTSLFPNKGHLVVLIILNLESLEDVSLLNLHRNALEAIEKATEYPEGKWLFISVKNADDLNDIKDLLKIKMGSYPNGRTESGSG